jgi:hypothetical protein
MYNFIGNINIFFMEVFMKKLFLVLIFIGLLFTDLFATNQITYNPFKLDTFPTTLTGRYQITNIIWQNAQAGDTITLSYTPVGGSSTEIINTTAFANGTSQVPAGYPLKVSSFTATTLTHGTLLIYVSPLN